MSLKLHIISFDVPFPADYGGVIDVYHKIRVLNSLGVEIYLHAFDYGRGEQKELEKYCKKVFYYPRKTGFLSFISSIPYIVKSRSPEELISGLLKDDYPILCEGIHSSILLLDKRFSGRNIAIRPTNIEHDYYRLLADRETNFFKKLFFKIEASKLRRFDFIHEKASQIFPVSDADFQYFKTHFPQVKSVRVFPFNSMDELEIKAGTGDYAFFHGNLSVAENEEVAKYIIQEIAPKTDFAIFIAGKNPSDKLLQFANESGVKIIANPSDAEMEKLVAGAQIQLMLTFQPTGFKHKLLLSVFKGRHIIANNQILSGSGMENLVEIANSSHEILNTIEELRSEPFTQEMIDLRQKNINPLHLNSEKAKEFLRWVKG